MTHRLLHGPPPPLPRRLDRALDRWARLPPRVRLLCWAMGIVVVLTQCSAWRDGVTARWGGDGVAVLQATRDLAAGEDPSDGLVRRRLPPVAVPPTAVSEPTAVDVLVLPLPAGAILTEQHLSVAGVAAALPPEQRAVPVPVDPALGLVPGSIVDLWAVDTARGPPHPLAEGRRVVAISHDRGRASALVVLPRDLVAQVTSAVGDGGLLLTLAPP